MKDHPWDLYQTWPVRRSEVVSIYKCPPPKKIFWGPLPYIWGAKKNQIFDRDFRTRHRVSPEWNVASINKTASVNLQCAPWKLTYFPWPLTQKRPRSVYSLWPTLRRPLRCNHNSGHMSGWFQFYLPSNSVVPVSAIGPLCVRGFVG